MNTRQLGVMLSFLMTLGFLSTSLAWDWPKWLWRDTPENTLKVMDQIETQQEVEQYSEYFTAQGKKLWSYLLTKNGQKSDAEQAKDQASFDYLRTHLQVDGDTCKAYYPTTRGAISDCKGYVLLVKQERWKFHDIIGTRALGMDVHISFAEFVDDPIKATLKNSLTWKTAIAVYTHGLSGVKGILDKILEGAK